MARYVFSMNKTDAVSAVKKALIGKIGILKDKDGCLTVGAPLMTAKIIFTEKEVTTSAVMFGRFVLGTVDSCIEQIEGFLKV